MGIMALNTAGATRSVLEQSRCQSVEVIQKSRTAPSPPLGICFLIPTPLQTHSSESPTPSICQASWPLVSHSLFLYFHIPTTDFWGLITRHLTNGPSVLPITQKKVSPSLTLTRCAAHRDETLKPTPPAAHPLRVTMTTTKEKGGALEVMEMCANTLVLDGVPPSSNSTVNSYNLSTVF